jgi:hypothetical protein
METQPLGRMEADPLLGYPVSRECGLSFALCQQNRERYRHVCYHVYPSVILGPHVSQVL